MHPHIPVQDLVWVVVMGRILRVDSPVRAELGLQEEFRDDALAYCTGRMDPETTRLALAATLQQAKLNKAFENSLFIGLDV